MAYHNLSCPETGGIYGSFEVFHVDQIEAEIMIGDGLSESFDPDTEVGDLVGYWWAAGFPGCLYDGGPVGPFPTYDEALADAKEDF